MKSLSLSAKLRLVFPRLLMGFVICTGYLAILHLIFILPHRFLLWEENSVLFFIPAVSAIVWLFLMRNSFRHFEHIGRYSSNLLVIYSFFFLLFGNMMVQNLIHDVAGSSKTVANTSALRSEPFYDTYTIKDWQIDTTQLTGIRSYTVTGKLNTELNLHMTAMVPVVHSKSPIAKPGHRVWLLIDFDETVANTYSNDTEKNKKLDTYCRRWLQEVKTRPLRYKTFHRLDTNYNRKTYQEAAEGITSTTTPQLILLEGNYSDGVLTVREIILSTLFFIFFFGALGVALCYQAKPLPENLRYGIAFEDYCAKLDKETGWIPILLPAYRYQLTPRLIILALALFIFQFTGSIHFGYFSFKELDQMGALRAGHYDWRLLTAPLLEENFFHLIFQLACWYVMGRLLEPLIPWQKLLRLYMGCALISGILHLAWGSSMLYVGGLGATMGWFGLLLALWYDKEWDYWDKEANKKLFRVAIALLFTGLFCAAIGKEEVFWAYGISILCGMFYGVTQKKTLLYADSYERATPSSE